MIYYSIFFKNLVSSYNFAKFIIIYFILYITYLDTIIVIFIFNFITSIIVVKTFIK